MKIVYRIIKHPVYIATYIFVYTHDLCNKWS